MIPEKEDETNEFKSGIAQLDKGLLSLTAMMNRHNKGTLWLGIDDDGKVIGIDVGDDTLEKIRNRISTYISPQIVADIKTERTDDGHEIIVIRVNGTDIPYSFDGRYYIRNITSNEQASPNTLKRLFMSGSSDLLKGKPSHIQDLTFSSFVSYMESMNIHTGGGKHFLESYGLTTSDGEYNTIAYLLSDQNDAGMQVVTFDGTDKGSMSKRTDYGHRCILNTTRSLIDHFSSLNITRVDLRSGVRKETNLFDFESVKEAIVNACVHNDWMNMIPPSFFVFDDRIEIQSYGAIPLQLTKEEFYEGKSMPVNKTLFDIFSQSRYSEQSGHGIPTIVRKYGRGCISMTESIITVSIPFAFEPDWVTSRKSSERNDDLTDKQKGILESMKKNRRATIKGIADENGMCESAVGKNISLLKRSGRLVNDGNNRINSWRIL